MKKYFLSFFIILSISELNSQNVGINSTGANADPSAALDIVSANKGLLIPRVALTALNSALPIITPLTSLLVYNTASAGVIPNNVTPGYYYWDGAKWISIAGAISGGLNWNVLGNAGTNASTNFLGTVDNQDLVFKTNNTESMRVLTNGNVGIGAINPLFALHVRSSTAATTGLFESTNTRAVIGFSDVATNSRPQIGSFGDDLFLQTNGIERMRILANGNVGIGIVSPNYKLDVVGGWTSNTNDNTFSGYISNVYSSLAGGHAPHFIGYRARGTSTAPLHPILGDGLTAFQGRNAVNINAWSGMSIITTENHNNTSLGTKLVFYNVPNGTTTSIDRMTIDHTGNVGINTLSPNNKLEITATNPNESGLRFTNMTSATPPTTANGKALSVDASGDVVLVPSAANSGADWSLTGNAGTTSGTNFLGTTDAQDLVFKTNNTEKMRVLSNGQIGIGTAIPNTGSILEIVGATKIPQSGTFLHNDPAVTGVPLTDGFRMKYDNDFFGISTDALVFEKTDVNQISPDGGIAFTNTGQTGTEVTSMVIRGDGKVGIGTKFPIRTLHVEGTIAQVSPTDVSHSMVFKNNVSGRDWQLYHLASTDGNAPNGFMFEHFDGLTWQRRMTIDQNGKVGIGISAPLDVLNVNGGVLVHGFSGSNGLTVSRDNTLAGGVNPRLRIVPDALRNFIFSQNGPLRLNVSGADDMTIETSGNVGIGTTSPLEKLDVSGKLLLENGFSATNGAVIYKSNTDYLYLGPQSGTSTDGGNINLFGSTNAVGGNPGGINFHVSTFGQAMTIDNNGNIGVGTSVPTAKFHVSGGSVKVSNTVDNIYQTSQAGNLHDCIGTYAGWDADGVYVAGYNVVNSAGSRVSKKIYMGGSGSTRMMIDLVSGNVGIGTTTPSSLLSVNGGADKVGGGAWAVFSDKRVKHNINTYTKGLEYILKINPVSFQYNGKGGYQADGKTYVGVIAQEIEQVLPSTVSKVKTADFEDQRIFDASELTFTLINAIKEQQQQIEKLKSENNDLKTIIKLEKQQTKDLIEKTTANLESKLDFIMKQNNNNNTSYTNSQK